MTDTLRHASQKHHEGGFERIRQQKRHVESTVSDVAGNANPICQTRWFGFAPHLVYEWRGCVKSCYKRTNQYSILGIREERADRLYSRNNDIRIDYQI